MDSKVRGALWEWAAGVIIGVIPLIAHVIAIGSNDPPPGKESDWISDILFVVVSTSGASSVSVVSRFLKGEMQPARLGKSVLGLSAITVLLLVAAATLYERRRGPCKMVGDLGGVRASCGLPDIVAIFRVHPGLQARRLTCGAS